MLGLLLILEGYHGISTHHAVVPGVTLIPGVAYLLIVYLVTLDVLKVSLGRELAWGRKQAIINISRIINLFMFINRTMRNLLIRKGGKGQTMLYLSLNRITGLFLWSLFSIISRM